MADRLLTSGELAMRTGLTPDTLRYYERLGLLPPAPRAAAGYRLYDPTTADRLAFIGKAKVLGVTTPQHPRSRAPTQPEAARRLSVRMRDYRVLRAAAPERGQPEGASRRRRAVTTSKKEGS